MKKNCFLCALFFIIAVSPLAAKPKAAADYTLDDLVYADLVSSINHVSEPYLNGDYIIFTQEYTSRYVGIAFDFEKYRTIHQFQIKKIRDESLEVKDSLYFYILKLPKTVQELNYRIVVDGLWTTDPMNSSRVYNQEAGLLLSHFDATRSIPDVTELKENGMVRFVYVGKSGQRVRLGGSFTNWDSWIYEFKEVKPGVYQCDLPLPPGQYEYAYYTGVNSFPDRTNPERCYSPDGKEASLLVVR